ncbi:MAG: hypothetical protein A2381_07010 [Bdellovibrionales bacterium RIFOXYB1_FULL_37_110]|nr:MAG: hypothetical protein A2417_14885 [Bdellovibrionales bacterium RIFOXYC1_FULL_37_79]OFZ57811.1 MAG: hypothetical protein A2381_07010 [Bdellovibrionales bacterium RIFOXYB1_FULL_37_110]OFZ62777.1 MAG: hypothetical protein A2577_16530 [Bdellovibrionales bacterium RIFOXYD1_FULL_36_51]
MMRNMWLILCLIMSACSIMEQSYDSNERLMASIVTKPVGHRAFFIIMFDHQVQDTRLNKDQTANLIKKSTNQDCAEKFLKEVARIFNSKEIEERINALYDEYGVEIHLGGIYQDKGGKISFDQIIQAYYVPNTNDHKTNQYLYQVRAVGEKNPAKPESILEHSDQYRIEFLSPGCEVDQLKINVYEEMLQVISENIKSAIKMLNENKINESSTREILKEFF